MPPTPTNETPLEFNAEQDQVVAALASALKLVALTLLALALIRVGRGVLEFSTNFFVFLGFLVEGMLTGLLGLILLSVSSDARYITQTQNYDRIHLFNAVDSLIVYTKFLLGLGVLVIVVEGLRILI